MIGPVMDKRVDRECLLGVPERLVRLIQPQVQLGEASQVVCHVMMFTTQFGPVHGQGVAQVLQRRVVVALAMWVAPRLARISAIS